MRMGFQLHFFGLLPEKKRTLTSFEISLQPTDASPVWPSTYQGCRGGLSSGWVPLCKDGSLAQTSLPGEAGQDRWCVQPCVQHGGIRC